MYSKITILFLSVVFMNVEGFNINDQVKWIVRNSENTDVQNVQDTHSGCECVHYDCGCCAYLDFPKIGLKDTGCVNVTYLAHDYGISLTFSIDGKVYFNETISARNPPPVCFGLPYLGKDVSICLDFYNMDITKQAFSGCIKVEARLLHILVEDYDIGCFRIPLSPKDLATLDVGRLQKWLHAVQMMQMQKKKLHKLGRIL